MPSSKILNCVVLVRTYVPPKRPLLQEPHSMTIQTTALLIITGLKSHKYYIIVSLIYYFIRMQSDTLHLKFRRMSPKPRSIDMEPGSFQDRHTNIIPHTKKRSCSFTPFLYSSLIIQFHFLSKLGLKGLPFKYCKIEYVQILQTVPNCYKELPAYLTNRPLPRTDGHDPLQEAFAFKEPEGPLHFPYNTTNGVYIT
jgi:hypothetical protein